MYTVGQVARFLGVSRDTLKYYEEKGLVNPVHDDENGYRKYNQFDIHDVITTNFYRELDIESKKIQEIRKSKDISDVETMLEEKKEDILKEIEYKTNLLNQIESVKHDCSNIKEYLGKFTIKEMKPIRVFGEITDYKADDVYDFVRNSVESPRKAVTLTSARRVIRFDDEGIKGDKFIVVKGVDDTEKDEEGNIIAHPKCIYTVIEDGRAVNGGKNIDQEVGNSIMKIAQDNGYTLLGLTYINILLTTYENGLERVYLEIYTPIK